MIGDVILFIKEKWKQLWCIHDYKYYSRMIPGFPDMYECKKCGRIK